MNKQYYEKVFSYARMDKYYRYHNDNLEKAVLHYKINIKISESFYPCISVLEVALRNSLNRELIKCFGTEQWYNYFSNTTGLANLVKEITEAQFKISRRKELITPSKIVAELTLGFWVRLFNAEYHNILWKDLRRAFPYLPKHLRQRKHISTPLNNFRNIRNRIYHNEPICWKFDYLRNIHNEINNIMIWINKDLTNFTIDLDNFLSVINESEHKLFKITS